MPATARMPLRTSQDAPCFQGAAGDLSRYIADVEALCRSHQRTTNAEFIKYAVYYTAGPTWDAFALTRDALPEPGTWDDFKAAICDIYPQHEAHTSAPLPASLPSPPMPAVSLPSLPPAAPVSPSLPLPPMSTASLSSLLPVAPVTCSSPQLPAPALMLSLAALGALPSPAPPVTPAIPAKSLLSASDAQSLQPVPPSLPAESAWLQTPLPPAVSLAVSPPHILPATVATLVPSQPHTLAPSIPPAACVPLIHPPPAPDNPPPTPDDKAFCWT